MPHTIERTVQTEHLTVQYWREQFAKLMKRATAKTPELAEKMGVLDAYFAGNVGYIRLNNIACGRGGLKATALAVETLEKVLGPEDPKVSRRLSRQKLNQ